ncbi:MAG: NAD(P)-binding domain-containing protein, partial [Treponema sp.]|nr:NAD(P)-binding domain-containing protein [Treponema sp.]
MIVRISCIGSGNMGLALMNGAAGIIGGANIGFSDVDAGKAQAAANFIGSRVYASNTEATGEGDYIFLAVKPQILGIVLKEIAPVLHSRLKSGNAPVLVSMAAGWSIAKIQELTGGLGIPESPHMPVIRIMPNTPALVSRGMTAMAASPEVPPEKIAGLEDILKGSGLVDRIDERYFDAITGLSGSGPAFVYMFIEALSDDA